ncbi:MAG: hypothetical protein PHQ01_01315 [Candidatus Pacebacteria bacterium]|nr:hypothetical protein [Candidatus Paceibacterota bacterium]
MKYKTISIEGSDGAGKATTTKLLKDYLSSLELGTKVASISFPRYQDTLGGKLCFEVLKSDRKDYYDFISRNPKIASLLYVMDRAESREDLEKMIHENDYLIFDRYISSNFIHQGGKISDDKEREELISFLSDLEYGEFGLPKPNITFFLHLPTNIAMANKEKQRLHNQNVKMDAGEDDPIYLENSNKSGLWCVEKYGWYQIACFDEVKQKQKTPEEVLSEILKVLGV